MWNIFERARFEIIYNRRLPYLGEESWVELIKFRKVVVNNGEQERDGLWKHLFVGFESGFSDIQQRLYVQVQYFYQKQWAASYGSLLWLEEPMHGWNWGLPRRKGNWHKSMVMVASSLRQPSCCVRLSESEIAVSWSSQDTRKAKIMITSELRSLNVSKDAGAVEFLFSGSIDSRSWKWDSHVAPHVNTFRWMQHREGCLTWIKTGVGTFVKCNDGITKTFNTAHYFACRESRPESRFRM